MSTHNMFLWRNNQNYSLIVTKYPPYLFYCKLLAALPKGIWQSINSSWCQWRLWFFIAALPWDLFNVFFFWGKIYKHVLWMWWKCCTKNRGLTPPSEALYQFDMSIPSPSPKRFSRALPYRCHHYTGLKLSVGWLSLKVKKILIHCDHFFIRK